MFSDAVQNLDARTDGPLPYRQAISCTAVQLAASQGLSATMGHHRNGRTVSVVVSTNRTVVRLCLQHA